MSEATGQFNGGVCSCGGTLRDAPYVGGDHDEIAYCPACGKHYGCWECDRYAEAFAAALPADGTADAE